MAKRPSSRLRAIVIATVSTVVAWIFLSWSPTAAEPLPAVRAAALPAEIADPPSVSMSPTARPDSSHPSPMRSLPPPPPPSLPKFDGFNVHGSVVSPQVQFASGGDESVFGVRSGGAEVRATRLLVDPTSPRTTECRYGRWIPIRDASGAFGFALEPGFWRIEAVHRPNVATEPGLTEAWCAVFAVERDVPVELGRHQFSAVVTRGIVINHAGRPSPGVLSFSDKMPRPSGSALPVTGCELALETDASARFAFTFASFELPHPDLLPVDPSVRDFYGDGTLTASDVTLRPVRLGGFHELRAKASGLASATLEIHGIGDADLVLIGADSASSRTIGPFDKGEDGVVRIVVEAPPGILRAELSTADLIDVRSLLIAEGARIELRPDWRAARTVEGVAAEGTAVRRVVRTPAGVFTLGGDRARDGLWRWRGLPPEDALEFEIDRRRIVVPSSAPLLVRID